MTDNKPEKNTLKSGKSKRARAGNERKPAGTPKLMIAAAVIIVVGAVVLFGPRLSSEKTGIGEQRSVVVTAPDTSAAHSDTSATLPDSTALALENSEPAEVPASRPRSSNVDIATESQSIVAESPDGSGLSSKEAAALDKKLASTPIAKPKPKAKPQEKIMPKETGGWIVQVGAYGVAANADKEALRLQSKGWDARVRGKSTPDGKMVFHVQIGYFSSRADGTLFARQNRKIIPGAFAEHK